MNLQYIYDQEEKILKEKEKKDLDELVEKINAKHANFSEEEATMRAKKYLSDKTKEANMKLRENLYKKGTSSKMNYNDVGIPKVVQYKLGSLLLYLMKETIKVKNE